MREIKFRAWGISDQRMFDVVKIDFENNIWTPDGEWWGQGPLMQFTGLKDKNGKEIYKSDILQHEGGSVPILVEWFKEEWTEDGFASGFHLSFTGDQYEVIGNIYENFELLK